jgi:Mg2+/citrate symporter
MDMCICRVTLCLGKKKKKKMKKKIKKKQEEKKKKKKHVTQSEHFQNRIEKW